MISILHARASRPCKNLKILSTVLKLQSARFFPGRLFFPGVGVAFLAALEVIWARNTL